MPDQTLEEMFQHIITHQDKTRASRPYVLCMGQDGIDMLKASFCGDTQKLKEISDRVSARAKESHSRESKAFIALHGQEIFDFVDKIKSVRSDTWMSSQNHPFNLRIWTWGDPESEDDGFSVDFIQGRFDYTYYIAGGYAGTGIVERDITMDRVLELIAAHPEGYTF